MCVKYSEKKESWFFKQENILALVLACGDEQIFQFILNINIGWKIQESSSITESLLSGMRHSPT